MALPFGGRFLPAIGNAVSDYGYGLAKGGFDDAFGIAAERGAQMQPYRDQQQQQAKTEAEKVAASNTTMKWLQQKAATDPDPRWADIMSGLDSGALDVGGAYQAAMAISAKPDPVKGIAINDRLVNPMTGEEMGNFSDPTGAASGDISMQPQWVIDPKTGKPAMGQLGEDGQLHLTAMPNGYEAMDPRELNFQRSLGTESGKTEAAKPANQIKAESALNTLEQKNGIVINAIDQAINQTSGWNTGNVMGNSGIIPGLGQGALDLGKTIETIQANIGFSELQTMRDNSPTGGALGQVTERELAFLQATIANIQQSQSEEQLDKNLKTLRDYLVQSQEQRRAAFSQEFGGQQQAPGGTTSTGVPWSVEP